MNPKTSGMMESYGIISVLYLGLTTTQAQSMAELWVHLKWGYFGNSACHKNSNEIIMHELLPGRGETGILLRASLPVRLAGYCSTGKKSLAMPSYKNHIVLASLCVA